MAAIAKNCISINLNFFASINTCHICFDIFRDLYNGENMVVAPLPTYMQLAMMRYDSSGETREQRIMEYIEANPRRWVAGLREGCMLHYEDGQMKLIGERPMRIFRKGQPTREVASGDDLSFLFTK